MSVTLTDALIVEIEGDRALVLEFMEWQRETLHLSHPGIFAGNGATGYMMTVVDIEDAPAVREFFAGRT